MDENIKIGLCISGGGFRATFFHLWLIRFLRRFGLLGQVKRIASVSGGSVLAAHLVLNWDRYTGSDDDYASAEKELIKFGERDIRGRIVRRWLFSIIFPVMRLFPVTTHRTYLLEREYARLLRNALLRDIEPGVNGHPTLHLLATSFTTGNLCSFSSEGFWNHDENAREPHRTGMLPLALAVASSSAFPPLFPPTSITRKMLDASNSELPYDPEFLTDGGIFDNLGFAGFGRILNSDNCDVDHLIISDASAQLDWDISGRFTRVISRTIRSTDILMQRVADFTVSRLDAGVSVKVFHLAISRLVLPSGGSKPLLVDFQKKLAKVRTDLDRFSPLEINCLVQHGDEVALSELKSLVDSHPDFKVLAKHSDVIGSPLDLPSDAIPATATTLNKSRVRGLRLFDPRDLVSYALYGYLTLAVCIAAFPYFYVAKRAVEGDLFQRSVQLSFATDRKPGPDRQFAGETDGALHIGSATIRVPANHVLGRIERPSGFFNFSRSTENYFAIQSVIVNDRPAFSADGSSKGVLIYIHGYNMTFESALMRAGQLAWDFQLPGHPMAYSWASQGTVLAYERDRELAYLSAPHFADYVQMLRASDPGPIDVIAEGLGALVLLDGAIRLAADPANAIGKKPFGQLIFAVPDVDAARFAQEIKSVIGLAEHITVVTAPTSPVMRAASMVAGAPRAGSDYSYLSSIKDIDTILLNDTTEGLNHSAFGSRHDAVEIMSAVLRRRPLSQVLQLRRRNDGVWETLP